MNPLDLFSRTSIQFIWRILSACLPAWTPWLRGPVSPRFACRAQYAASVALLDDVIGNVEPRVGLPFSAHLR